MNRASYLVILLAVLAIVPARGQPAPSQGAAGTAASTPTKYRLVNVPNEDKIALTRGYQPMRRDQFEEAVRRLSARPGGRAPETQLERVRLFAVLDGQLLRDGCGLFTVRRMGEKAPVMLEPLSLALDTPYWLDNPTQPVSLGSDESGRHWLGVERSATLVAPWSLRGRYVAPDRSEFLLQIPASPVSTLVVAVPAGTRVQSSQGVLVRWSGTPSLSADLPEAASFLRACEQGYETWQVELGGADATRLVVEVGESESPSGLAVARQTQRYTFLPSRLELQVDLNIDCLQRAQRTLQFVASAELRLAQVRYGDQTLDWTVEPVAGGYDAYEVTFPQPLSGMGRAVRLEFHAEALTDRFWHLPTVRVANVLWTEGRTELVFADSLVLEEINADRCRLVRRGVAASGIETLEYQSYASDAEWQLTLRPRHPELHVHGGVAIRIDREAITGRVMADVKSSWGEAFRIRARIFKPWTVDRVEVVPADVLDTSAGSWRFDNGVLEIPLRESVAPGRPLRLIIDAHGPTPPERMGLRGDPLRLLKFEEAASNDILLRVFAPSPLGIRLSHDVDTQRIAPSSLDPVSRELLGSSDEGVIVRPAPPWYVTAYWTEEQPNFVTDIQVDATLDATHFVEAYTIQCVPEALPLRQLRIQLTQSRETPLVWTLGENEPGEPLAARRVGGFDRGEAVPRDELWEVDLPAPTNRPFTLHAVRRTEGSGPFEVAFASVPQAVSESGRCVLRSDEPVRWESGGLEPVPPDEPLPLANRPQAVRGVFRFQPSHANRLRIERLGVTGGQAAWIWRAQWMSRILMDGQSVHAATYLVQNTGAKSLQFRFPHPVTVQSATVDGRGIPVVAEPVRTLSVALPKGVAFPRVQLRFQSKAAPLGLFPEVAAPFPGVSVPVLHTDWTIFSPPDYRLLWGPGTKASSTAVRLGIFDRLFAGWVRRRSVNAESDRARNGVSIGRFETELRQALEANPPTWHAVWQRLQTVGEAESPSGGWRILLDASLLASDSPLRRPPPAVTPGDAAAARRALAESGLRVALVPGIALVTLADGWWHLGDCVGKEPPIGAVRQPGWLTAALASADTAPWGWIPLPPEMPAEPEGPWRSNSGSTLSLFGEAGWNVEVCQLGPLDAPFEGRLRFFRSGISRPLGWAFFCIACGLVLCMGRRYRRTVPLMVGITAAIALVLPQWLHPVGSGVFLGTLVSSAFILLAPVRPLSASTPHKSERPRLSWRWLLAGGTAVLLASVCWTYAQETRPATEPMVVDGEYRVIVPVDEAGNPVGDYVYVPRSLFDRLQEALRDPDSAGTWRLLAARHTVRDGLHASNASRDVIEIRSELVLQTMSSAEMVSLPYRRREVQLIAATLDHQPADVRWSATGESLVIGVPSPGRHDVELVLGVKSSDAPATIAIPSLATTTAIWQMAGSSLPSGIREAVGTVSTVPTGFRALLGRKDRLPVKEAVTTESEETLPARCQQFSWLRVRPNSVVLDVHWRIDAADGRLTHLTIQVDPNVRLLPLAANQPVEGDPVISDEEPTSIRLKLRPAVGARFTLSASFHVLDTAGIGVIPIPRVRLASRQVSSHWLAASAANGLVIQPSSPGPFPTVEPEAFLSEWGTDTDRPFLVLNLTPQNDGAEERFSLSSRFAPGTVRWSDVTMVEVREDRLEVTWDAALTIEGGPILLHRIELPADFQIRTVSITQSDEVLENRWAVGRDNTATLFFAVPAGSRQQVSLRGAIPLSRRLEVPVPRFRLLGATRDSSLVRVLRHGSVARVTLEDAERWQSEDVPAMERPGVIDGRPVGVWQLPADESEETTAMLRIVRNPAQADSLLATRVTRSGGNAWQAEIELLVKVTDGLLDVVRLELPADWEGPFELEPAYPYLIRALPGQNRRELLIRPPQAIADEFRVRLRGRLAGNGDRLRRVPDVMPIGMQRVVRFVVLPARIESQTLIWSTSGLQSRPLPPQFEMAREGLDRYDAYQVLGSSFHAAIQRIERVTGFPQIRLADVRAVWRGEGTYHALASLDLEPGGASMCRVRCPPSLRLLAAVVDTIPVTFTKESSGQYIVPLGSPQLPQRVELLWEGEATELSANHWQLIAPEIDGFPIARTLWTVAVPWYRDDLFVAAPTSTAQLQLLRLESAAAILDSAFDMASESGPVDAANWMRLWSSRLAEARQAALLYAGVDASAGRGTVAERVQAIDAMWRAEERRLGSENVERLLADPNAPIGDVSWPWKARRVTGLRVLRAALPGASATILLEATPAPTDLLARCVAALLAVMAGGLLVLTRRRTVRLNVARELPQTWLALIGVAWATWLDPAWIGWSLLAAAMVLALAHPWMPWRGHPVRS